MTIPKSNATKPSDYGLREGWTISAGGSSDPDIYIVNEWGYKRLFLNPAIFRFYGHLGGFAAVHNVSTTTRDAFPTSGLFRNCETNDPKVYGVETIGEDAGTLHWINTTGAQAVADDPDFMKKVFCINTNEFNWYTKSSAYTSARQIPSYSRISISNPVTPISAEKNYKEEALARLKQIITTWENFRKAIQEGSDIYKSGAATLKTFLPTGNSSLDEGIRTIITETNEYEIKAEKLLLSIDHTISVLQGAYEELVNKNYLLSESDVGKFDEFALRAGELEAAESTNVSAEIMIDQFLAQLNDRLAVCKSLHNPEYPQWLQERRSAYLGCY